MQIIQINTDHNIKGHEALAAQVNGVVERVLGRFSDQITRVEVHLRDENTLGRLRDQKRRRNDASKSGPKASEES